MRDEDSRHRVETAWFYEGQDALLPLKDTSGLVARSVRVCSLALVLTGLLAQATTAASARNAIRPLYTDPGQFDTAINGARARLAEFARPGDITGLVVPHHLVAADLIAAGFLLVEGQPFTTVIIFSPDHFRRSRKPFATTLRDFDTVYGRVSTRKALALKLLAATDLVEDSALFDSEHGVAAILPFLRRALPRAKIVPVAVGLSSSRAEWDRMFALLAPMLGPGTLIVQSTDFSHYLSFVEARRRDQETLAVVATGDLNAITALRQPQHNDSVGANYLQFRLQREVFGAGPVVLFNRNQHEYNPRVTSSTTSYMVQVFSPRWARQVAPEMPGSQRICFAGDTFLGRANAQRLANPAVAERIAGLLGRLLDGCRLVINLEGVVVPEPPAGLPPLKLAMPHELTLDWLRRLGVIAVGLANNHAHDLGLEAYEAMARTLRESSIQVIGDGDMADLGAVRVVALTDLDNTRSPSSERLNGERISGLAATAEPPLFAFVHWGQEFRKLPGAREMQLSAALQDAGLSAIIGAHPHVAADAIDLIGESFAPRAYSLGNFLFDQSARRASGAILEVRFFGQKTFALRLIPIPNISDAMGASSMECVYCDGRK